jgi:hypothetical protein
MISIETGMELEKIQHLSLKIHNRARGVSQELELLPRKHEPLCSIPSSTKDKNKNKRKQNLTTK